ncbi:hypothetical protein CCHR01_05509 [Colletotrichum chrysophilum]|uniref:Uncharacterized protein n=1 Tax=Colletotrichum chrysophilum TaxID=1836956 RepID=A0AAD9AQV4_9PEZI|nr:hypothetical protein CCHR01_05509 [Colletotrichum chrysophilum]
MLYIIEQEALEMNFLFSHHTENTTPNSNIPTFPFIFPISFPYFLKSLSKSPNQPNKTRKHVLHQDPHHHPPGLRRRRLRRAHHHHRQHQSHPHHPPHRRNPLRRRRPRRPALRPGQRRGGNRRRRRVALPPAQPHRRAVELRQPVPAARRRQRLLPGLRVLHARGPGPGRVPDCGGGQEAHLVLLRAARHDALQRGHGRRGEPEL